MLDQRLRRWSNVVQMLHKCFVFAGIGLQKIILHAYKLRHQFTVPQYHTQKPAEFYLASLCFRRASAGF